MWKDMKMQCWCCGDVVMECDMAIQAPCHRCETLTKVYGSYHQWCFEKVSIARCPLCEEECHEA